MRSAVRASGRPLRLAGAAALAGAVLWSPAGAAQAGEPETAGAVAFSGGCGLLSTGLGASSDPDAARVSVPAGSQLAFTNQLGQPATLRLDGETATEVAPGDTATVAFHDGPVTAAMQISCLLGKPAGQVVVDVTPATSSPQPAPVSPSVDPAPAPATSSSPGSRTPAAGPGQQAGSGDAGGAPRAGAAPGESPFRGWASNPPEAGAQAVPGLPHPVPEPAPTGGADPRSEADEFGLRWGDPADGGGAPLDPATVENGTAGGGVAAEQMSRSAGPVPDDGPIGLLALVATVCVAGVSAGAARAIMAQRANRAELA